MQMKSTNRRWQSHLRAKGIIPFLLDRLQAHALSSRWQFDQGAFHFPIDDRDTDDELTRAYFELIEHFPYELCIEVTNRCNLSCAMCARSVMTRPPGCMTQTLFEQIIDEVAQKQPHAYLHYYGIGEPLTDPGLFDKLDYARARGMSNSVLFTNGQLLAEGDTHRLLANSGVAVIGVDLDGFSQETYGAIRVGGQFEHVLAGIRLLSGHIREKRLRTRLELAYHIWPGVNDRDIAPFVSWCERAEHEYKLVPMHSWAGLRKDLPVTDIEGMPDQHHEERSCPCAALWSNLMIAWDGRVGLCFQDADIREPLGDLNTQTIGEVWRGSHLDKRREHLDGKFGGLCKDCDSYTAVDLPAKGSPLYPESARGESGS